MVAIIPMHDTDYTVPRMTPRERGVLRSLCDGLSNKEIARELGIEDVTVRLHLRGVYRKLGVNNRAHAVSTALSIGIVLIATPNN